MKRAEGARAICGCDVCLVRRALVACRRELSRLQFYHVSDLVGEAVNCLDRRDDSRGNR